MEILGWVAGTFIAAIVLIVAFFLLVIAIRLLDWAIGAVMIIAGVLVFIFLATCIQLKDAIMGNKS